MIHKKIKNTKLKNLLVITGQYKHHNNKDPDMDGCQNFMVTFLSKTGSLVKFS